MVSVMPFSQTRRGGLVRPWLPKHSRSAATKHSQLGGAEGSESCALRNVERAGFNPSDSAKTSSLQLQARHRLPFITSEESRDVVRQLPAQNPC
jgi:hypothetical protein